MNKLTEWIIRLFNPDYHREIHDWQPYQYFSKIHGSPTGYLQDENGIMVPIDGEIYFPGSGSKCSKCDTTLELRIDQARYYTRKRHNYGKYEWRYCKENRKGNPDD